MDVHPLSIYNFGSIMDGPLAVLRTTSNSNSARYLISVVSHMTVQIYFDLSLRSSSTTTTQLNTLL